MPSNAKTLSWRFLAWYDHLGAAIRVTDEFVRDFIVVEEPGLLFHVHQKVVNGNKLNAIVRERPSVVYRQSVKRARCVVLFAGTAAIASSLTTSPV